MNPKIKKAIILPIREIAYRFGFMHIFYWADKNIFELGNIFIMPAWWYIGLFHVCMWALKFRYAHHAADVVIHHIPFSLRVRAS